MIRLGIDVGMHNVHAALADGQSVLAAAQVEAMTTVCGRSLQPLPTF